MTVIYHLSARNLFSRMKCSREKYGTIILKSEEDAH